MKGSAKRTKRIVVVLLALLLALLTFYKVLGARSQGLVPDIGVVDGHLKPCPDSPNCVSTLSTDAGHAFERILLTDPRSAIEAFIKIAEPRGGTVMKRDENYVHLVFKSAIMGFIDDVEVYVDSTTGSLEARSASRVGKSDLGVNRKRLNKLVDEFKARQ